MINSKSLLHSFNNANGKQHSTLCRYALINDSFLRRGQEGRFLNGMPLGRKPKRFSVQSSIDRSNILA